jgi:DNA-binding PadR family transcriptional regulator
MSELVDDLQRAGYLERRPDPRDGRAKLIGPTRKGRQAIVQALRAVREIEADYARIVGDDRFAALVGLLQDLIDARPPSGRELTSPGPASADDAPLPRSSTRRARAKDE